MYELNVSTTAATKPVTTVVQPVSEGCIENDKSCNGNCSGCCSKKSINLWGDCGLGKKCVSK